MVPAAARPGTVHNAAAMRPFRFGVQLGAAWSRRAWFDKARVAEDLGYDVVLTADHLDPDAPPPFLGLPLVAEATSRLRVGTFVCNNDLRHPVVLAHEAAMVDLLTDGRLELGIGAGWAKAEYDAAGLSFDPPRVRVDRFEEAVTVVSGLLRGERVAFRGAHYAVDHQQVAARQSPRPPLLIGGDGPRMLGIAARLADIVGLVGLRSKRDGSFVPAGMTTGAVRQRLDRVRTAAGDRFGNLELNILVQRVELTDTPLQAAAALSGHLAGVEPESVLSSPFVLLGTPGQIADRLLEQRHTLGISYPVVFERDMHAMAEVIARLR